MWEKTPAMVGTQFPSLFFFVTYSLTDPFSGLCRGGTYYVMFLKQESISRYKLVWIQNFPFSPFATPRLNCTDCPTIYL